MPLFSIIIPTYNRPVELGQLIRELTQQISTQWEIVVVDDSKQPNPGLNDEFKDVPIVYCHRTERLGVSSARNFGAEKANGKYLAFLDDDDRVSPEWLLQFETLLQDDPDVLFCGMERVGNNQTRGRFVLPSKNQTALVIPGSFVLSKKIFEHVGGYDTQFNFGENTELFFRIRALEPRIAYTDKICFFYNQSQTGLSQNLLNKIKANQMYLEKHVVLFNQNKRYKQLSLSIIGVSFLRLGRRSEARAYILQYLKTNPTDITAFARLIVSWIPFLTNYFYRRKLIHAD